MFDFLKRGRLVRRGLATQKTRRRRLRSELMRHLEYAPHSKALIFAIFAAGLALLVFSGQQPEPTKNFVIALLVLATAITQLWINQPKSFFAKLANSADFRRHSGATRGHEAPVGDLQQRQLPAP